MIILCRNSGRNEESNHYENDQGKLFPTNPGARAPLTPGVSLAANRTLPCHALGTRNLVAGASHLEQRREPGVALRGKRSAMDNLWAGRCPRPPRARQRICGTRPDASPRAAGATAQHSEPSLPPPPKAILTRPGARLCHPRISLDRFPCAQPRHGALRLSHRPNHPGDQTETSPRSGIYTVAGADLEAGTRQGAFRNLRVHTAQAPVCDRRQGQGLWDQ
jgi:hypothetical protein